ncbi:hypothetical protein L3X39_11030 [Sabulilitoribacter multivorans]|uniref:IPT/TIG domain-containing protein n=1 Tax=Flaviramulus multivorans TaxID=1304750 RepID=A0ABS9IKN2_9FLAO|nr:hypothetical protein [Flaviramulus multivorans]MCF7561171.1 hypothetical protein [Flaviramulus multivorans]
MKYFYKLFSLVLITCLCSCSQDGNEPKPIFKLSSTNTFIGDTLTVSGKNLDQIVNIRIFNEDIDPVYSDLANLISKTNTEIKFIVPEMYNEKATIYFGSNLESIDIELFGYIPFSYQNNGTIIRNAQIDQILDDDIAYCYHRNWSQRFKLYDYYSKLEGLPPLNRANNSLYYYVEENIGYHLVSNGTRFQVFSFNDKIGTRNLEFNMSYEDLNQPLFVRKMEFVTNNLAYIMTNNYEIFQVIDGVVMAFNDLYPQLNNIPYSSFKVMNDDSIILFSNEQNYIIKLKNGEVNQINFAENAGHYDNFINVYIHPTFFNNEGGFYSKTEHKIYKSVDYGQTWSAYDVNFAYDENMFIQYLGGNQFILHRYLISPNNIDLKSKYISTDNGKSWRRIFHSSSDYGGYIRMHDEYGFSGTLSYGLVKFRRFPNGF